MAHAHTHDHKHNHDHAHEHDHGPGPAPNAGGDACCSAGCAAEAMPTFHGGRAYKVRGMDCAEEVAVLKQAVGPAVGGADRLAFDVLNGRMTVAMPRRSGNHLMRVDTGEM